MLHSATMKSWARDLTGGFVGSGTNAQSYSFNIASIRQRSFFRFGLFPKPYRSFQRQLQLRFLVGGTLGEANADAQQANALAASSETFAQEFVVDPRLRLGARA